MSRRTGPGVPAPLDAVLSADRRWQEAEAVYASYAGDPKSGKAAPPRETERYLRACEDFLRVVLGREEGTP